MNLFRSQFDFSNDKKSGILKLKQNKLQKKTQVSPKARLPVYIHTVKHIQRKF